MSDLVQITVAAAGGRRWVTNKSQALLVDGAMFQEALSGDFSTWRKRMTIRNSDYAGSKDG